MVAHVDGVDPCGDLPEGGVVGECGDDGRRSGWACLRPGGAAVGDDDDGGGSGCDGGLDAGAHAGAASALEVDVAGAGHLGLGGDVGVDAVDADAVAGYDSGEDGVDSCDRSGEVVLVHRDNVAQHVLFCGP